MFSDTKQMFLIAHDYTVLQKCAQVAGSISTRRMRPRDGGLGVPELDGLETDNLAQSCTVQYDDG
jgi:hypothetical protein